LILDNHDDFGGHARRCEMRIGNRLLISYGGSESIQSPDHLWSERASGLLEDLGVEPDRFETAFHRTLYPDLGLSRGLLFKRETFGTDRLVTGDPTPMVADDIPPDRLNAGSAKTFIEAFPIDGRSREQLIELYTKARDFWPESSIAQKIETLSSMSYRSFLTERWGLTSQAARTFQMRPHDFFAIGIDLLPAFEAAGAGYPGFQGLGLPSHRSDLAKVEDPYIHHFPDGNASLARLLVRRLIPDTAPGTTMEDIVLAPFDYARLDSDAATRLRLESTVVAIRNTVGGADVGYVHRGTLRRARAKNVIYAGYNMMLPYLMDELKERQRSALGHGVKAPLVYVKVAVRNWRAWIDAGVHEVTNTLGFYSRLKLDYPVSLGGYQFARDPRDPIILHLVHVPIAERSKDQRTAWREGRNALYTTSFGDFERHATDELGRILGKTFNPARDVAAITVFRWAHGYAYGFNSLFDKESELELQDRARARVGRVSIANSDAAWSAYAHAAIDEAARAVDETKRAD
jgi:spermidine dehydrogenase